MEYFDIGSYRSATMEPQILPAEGGLKLNPSLWDRKRQRIYRYRTGRLNRKCERTARNFLTNRLFRRRGLNLSFSDNSVKEASCLIAGSWIGSKFVTSPNTKASPTEMLTP